MFILYFQYWFNVVSYLIISIIAKSTQVFFYDTLLHSFPFGLHVDTAADSLPVG